MPKDSRLDMRISKDLKDYLIIRAGKEGRTVTGLVMHILRQYQELTK